MARKRSNVLDRLSSWIRFQVSLYVRVLAHPETPRWSRRLIALAVAYALSPIDLIPDGIPVLGLLDDLLIIPALVLAARLLIPRHVLKTCRDELLKAREAA